MLERDVERRLVAQLKKLGIKHIKLSAIGRRGLPDRQIFLPGGRSLFIELKSPDRKDNLSTNQEMEISALRALGFPVLVSCDAKECVSWILEFVKSAGPRN